MRKTTKQSEVEAYSEHAGSIHDALRRTAILKAEEIPITPREAKSSPRTAVLRRIKPHN